MNEWKRYVECAIKQYNVKKPVIEFIRHNENLTCKIIDNVTKRAYVLRIHKPIDGFSLNTVQHSYENLVFELNFIKEIKKQTNINLQEAVKNKEGHLISKIIDSVTSKIIYVTMLSWIDGKTMSHEDINWEEEAYLTGVMTAKLHQFSVNWKYSQKENRHRYNQEKVRKTVMRIKEAVNLKLINNKQYHMIEQGANRIIELMLELDRKPNTKGYIHADLQKSNLIVQNHQILPIDFGLSGYGYYYMDLGGLSADFTPLAIRKALLAGYRLIRNLPEADMKYIEGFFIYTILLAMETHLHNPKFKEWYLRRTEAICNDYISPFLNQISFYERI